MSEVENENPEALQSVQEEGEPENAATEADSASLEQSTDPANEAVSEPVVEPAEGEPVEPVASEDDTVQAEQTEGDNAATAEADAPADTLADGEGGTSELAATEGVEVAKHAAGDDGAVEATPAEAADGEVAEDASAVAVEGGEEKTEAGTEEAEIVQSSETFDEEGGPVIEIAEKLSHGGSPTGADGDFPSEPMELPDPRGTPPLASPTSGNLDTLIVGGEDLDTLEEEYSVDGDFPTFDRAALLEKYKEALEERQKIQQQNSQIQHKLAEYFRKKKTDDRGQEMEKNVTDQEQRYLKYMSNLEELQNEQDRLNENILIQTEDAKSRCDEKQLKVETASTEFMQFKYDVAKTAVNSRSGKAIPLKNVEQLQLNEDKKEQEVIAVRLENIKLKNRLKKREQQLKAKEELAEGLHLIDFEQLKIENQTYNEKIEERNEEILKLRRKITTTVQVLTHLKEKLQFVQGENGEQRSKLRDIDVTVAQRRDILTKMKQVRDALRTDNSKLKHKSGLLGNEPLLRDFELRKDEGDDLRVRLAHLKEDHIELNMNLNSLRMKIERAQKM